MNMLSIQDLGINVTEINEETVKNSEVLLIAVKPHVVPKVLQEVSHCITKDHLIVSVAAGVTIETIEKVCCTTICHHCNGGHSIG